MLVWRMYSAWKTQSEFNQRDVDIFNSNILVEFWTSVTEDDTSLSQCESIRIQMNETKFSNNSMILKSVRQKLDNYLYSILFK